MGCTACTEPQCLYKGDLYLLPTFCWISWTVNFRVTSWTTFIIKCTLWNIAWCCNSHVTHTKRHARLLEWGVREREEFEMQNVQNVEKKNSWAGGYLKHNLSRNYPHDHKRVELYLYSPYVPYGLYRASVELYLYSPYGPYGLCRASVELYLYSPYVPYGLYRASVELYLYSPYVPYGLYRASVELYLYSPYRPYGLYRTSLPVQRVHFTFTLLHVYSFWLIAL